MGGTLFGPAAWPAGAFVYAIFCVLYWTLPWGAYATPGDAEGAEEYEYAAPWPLLKYPGRCSGGRSA
jgi:hypothetical protein